MTPPPRSIAAAIADVATEAAGASIAGRRALDPAIAEGLAAADPDLVDARLERLRLDADRLLVARDPGDFLDALRDWGNDLVALASLADEAASALVVALLRWKLPRLAAVLAVGGVIVDHPTVGPTIDWQALRDFLVDPPALVDEDFWGEVFAAEDIEGTGRMPALLLALLLLAPDTVRAMRRGDVQLAALEPPSVQPSASARWRALRENSLGWVPITFPLRPDPDGSERLVFSEFTDLRGDFQPALAMSVLIRSQRREAGGGNVTDFEVWFHPSSDAAFHELRSDTGLVMRLEPGVRAGLGYDGGQSAWNAAVRPRAAGDPINEARLFLRRDTPEGRPDLLFGPPYDTRLVVQDLGAELRMRQSGEPSVEVVGKAEGFAVVLTNRWFRSLGAPNDKLREGLRFDLDLDLRVTEGAGFSLAADGGLTVRWHIDKEFELKALKAKIHSVTVTVPIRATEDHFDVRAEVRSHLSATVGPVTLVLDGAGGWVGWWADTPGGEKECIGLLPPTGAGLALDLPGVKVGGFLDFTGGPNDRYAGVVAVAIEGPKDTTPFSVTGFGIHELTGTPGAADRKTSVIAVLGMTFSPGLPLGWGITLTGVGGLVGINRRADTDALRERLTSGAVGNVLFADDPIRNAPVLLGDLGALFPPQAGVHVVGITCQLSWLSLGGKPLVRVAVGIVVELPGPTKVVILGSARIEVPRFESILKLGIDVVGVVDVVRETFELDATIREGVVCGVFKVTGDGAIRASWGDRPYLMATLGGFYPGFDPEPAVFPTLARILLTVDKNQLPKSIRDNVSISAKGYLAVTTNTIQFGAELEVVIKAGNWSVQGLVGGDALIRRPFFFEVSLHGSVRVRYRGRSLLGVRFKGTLKGPSPLVLSGEACIELLFFDACWEDSFELGDSDLPALPVLASLVPALTVELESIANLSVVEGEDRHALLSVREVGDRLVVSPLGKLTWSQQRVPLGFAVSTFEGHRLDEPQRVTVAASGPTEPLLDWFSPGTFVELTESEAIALPAFERHPAGVVIRLDESRSPVVSAVVEVQEIRLPEPPRPGRFVFVPDAILDRLSGRMSAVESTPAPPRFELDDDRFAVVAADGSRISDGVSAVVAYTTARARGGSVQHATDRLVSLPG